MTITIKKTTRDFSKSLVQDIRALLGQFGAVPGAVHPTASAPVRVAPSASTYYQVPTSTLGRFGPVPGTYTPTEKYDVEADRARILALEKLISDTQAGPVVPSGWGMPTIQDTTAQRAELAGLREQVYQYDQGQKLNEYQRAMDNPMFDLVANSGAGNPSWDNMSPTSRDIERATAVEFLTADERQIYNYFVASDEKKADQYLMGTEQCQSP